MKGTNRRSQKERHDNYKDGWTFTSDPHHHGGGAVCILDFVMFCAEMVGCRAIVLSSRSAYESLVSHRVLTASLDHRDLCCGRRWILQHTVSSLYLSRMIGLVC
jgi:hypothetical protein